MGAFGNNECCLKNKLGYILIEVRRKILKQLRSCSDIFY